MTAAAADPPSVGGRVAFVSGASRGIGAGLAERFAERGLSLVLCARTKPSLAENDRVITRSVDVRDEAAVEALAVEAEARFGGIDLWVNNAGVLDPIDPVRDVAAEAFRRHLDINLTGVFLGSRTYVRQLRRRRATTEPAAQGVLINLSSGASSKAYAGWGPYCAAKAAVERLTEVIALEEADAGLRAYSVAPGVVDTDMQALIRETSGDRFPDVERFRALEREGAFNSTRFVADELLAIAFDPGRQPASVAVRLADERAASAGSTAR